MDAMEFGDDKEGLTKEEYNKFIAALPENFQRKFEEMHRVKTFRQIAGNDNVIDLKEFTALADRFALQQSNSVYFGED